MGEHGRKCEDWELRWMFLACLVVVIVIGYRVNLSDRRLTALEAAQKK